MMCFWNGVILPVCMRGGEREGWDGGAWGVSRAGTPEYKGLPNHSPVLKR